MFPSVGVSPWACGGSIQDLSDGLVTLTWCEAPTQALRRHRRGCSELTAGASCGATGAPRAIPPSPPRPAPVKGGKFRAPEGHGALLSAESILCSAGEAAPEPARARCRHGGEAPVPVSSPTQREHRNQEAARPCGTDHTGPAAFDRSGARPPALPRPGGSAAPAPARSFPRTEAGALRSSAGRSFPFQHGAGQQPARSLLLRNSGG